MTHDLELDHFYAWEAFVGPVTVPVFLAEASARGATDPQAAVREHLAFLHQVSPTLPPELLADLERALLEHIALNPASEPDPPFV